MIIREITDLDKQDLKISTAIDILTARFGADLSLVLIEPEHGEDLIIRPDMPQFSKNIAEQTQLPVTKIASSQNKDDTKKFGYAQTVHGMSVGPFYDIQPPSYFIMTDGPVIASVEK